MSKMNKKALRLEALDDLSKILSNDDVTNVEFHYDSEVGFSFKGLIDGRQEAIFINSCLAHDDSGTIVGNSMSLPAVTSQERDRLIVAYNNFEVSSKRAADIKELESLIDEDLET